MTCIDCGRALRPRGTHLTDHPGTLAQAPGPRCFPCYRQVGPLRASRPQKCRNCRRALRGSHDRIDGSPGTVRHAGQGLCVTCYRYRNTLPTAADGGVDSTVAGASATRDPEAPVRPDAALLAFLNRRKERLAHRDPAQGRLVSGEK